MKFNYDGKADGRECVAYIDKEGALCLKVTATHSECSIVCIEQDGFFHFNLDWLPKENATHKFYFGDKITITF